MIDPGGEDASEGGDERGRARGLCMRRNSENFSFSHLLDSRTSDGRTCARECERALEWPTHPPGGADGGMEYGPVRLVEP